MIVKSWATSHFVARPFFYKWVKVSLESVQQLCRNLNLKSVRAFEQFCPRYPNASRAQVCTSFLPWISLKLIYIYGSFSRWSRIWSPNFIKWLGSKDMVKISFLCFVSVSVMKISFFAATHQELHSRKIWLEIQKEHVFLRGNTLFLKNSGGVWVLKIALKMVPLVLK